jgi:hypothetical protein
MECVRSRGIFLLLSLPPPLLSAAICRYCTLKKRETPVKKTGAKQAETVGFGGDTRKNFLLLTEDAE